MEHSEIIKHPDGSRIKITAFFSLSGRASWEEQPRWDYMVHYCPPKKRTFKQIFGNSEYWPKEAEIKSCKMELWHKLKPI